MAVDLARDLVSLTVAGQRRTLTGFALSPWASGPSGHHDQRFNWNPLYREAASIISDLFNAATPKGVFYKNIYGKRLPHVFLILALLGVK